MPLDSSLAVSSDPDASLARLDDALRSLEKVDVRKTKVVELRFFGGFSVEETAEALGISERTVMNDWKFAKVWLLREMGGRGKESEL